MMTSRQSAELSSTFAVSMLVTFFLRLRAISKALRPMRSISLTP
jgi:hypothetical protein